MRDRPPALQDWPLSLLLRAPQPRRPRRRCPPQACTVKTDWRLHFEMHSWHPATRCKCFAASDTDSESSPRRAFLRAGGPPFGQAKSIGYRAHLSKHLCASWKNSPGCLTSSIAHPGLRCSQPGRGSPPWSPPQGATPAFPPSPQDRRMGGWCPARHCFGCTPPPKHGIWLCAEATMQRWLQGSGKLQPAAWPLKSSR